MTDAVICSLSSSCITKFTVRTKKGRAAANTSSLESLDSRNVFIVSDSKESISILHTQHALKHKCVFTRRQGYVRELEFYVHEDDARRGGELTPSILLFCLFILLSLLILT